MALDITDLTGMGITPYVAQWVDFNSNPRNSFKYSIKFEYYTYADVSRSLLARFSIQRKAEYNGVYENDIAYTYDSIANDNSYVDKMGNYVESPESFGYWGTEFERMSIIFSAPIADTDILNGYMSNLFNMGIFDKPKMQ